MESNQLTYKAWFGHLVSAMVVRDIFHLADISLFIAVWEVSYQYSKYEAATTFMNHIYISTQGMWSTAPSNRSIMKDHGYLSLQPIPIVPT